jgi:arginine N-succinyltransferase
MSFIVRQAKQNDLEDIYALSQQFVLLNLPANRESIEKKISRSLESFAGKRDKQSKAEFLFVLEDLKKSKVIGCSLILAKHGTVEAPHYSFQVLKKERHSEDLGIGFIHHVLKLSEQTDGPSEIGGLLLDSEYRSNPHKLGKLISLSRFMFMGQYPEKFQEQVLCEFAPHLTDSGKSHLWEELGRKFTGLTYEEADRLSLKNKEFIKQLFPIEHIYLSLLSPEVRMNLGKVSKSTEPAKHLLSKIGFKYINEIDPFDGGPHYGAKLSEISLVKYREDFAIKFQKIGEALPVGLASIQTEDQFYVCYLYGSKESSYFVDEELRDVIGGKIKFSNMSLL